MSVNIRSTPKTLCHCDGPGYRRPVGTEREGQERERDAEMEAELASRLSSTMPGGFDDYVGDMSTEWEAIQEYLGMLGDAEEQ